MIFTASLGTPVKKALGKNVRPSTVSKISANMPLDPETTEMTVVILGPKDFVGPKGSQLSKALNHKHPNICVIYMYINQNEEDLCSNAYKEQVRKITDKTVGAAFEKYVGEHADETGQRVMSSADFDTPAPPPAESQDFLGMEPGDDEDWSPTPMSPPPFIAQEQEQLEEANGSNTYAPRASTQQLEQKEDIETSTEQSSAPQAQMGIPIQPSPVLPTQPISSEPQPIMSQGTAVSMSPIRVPVSGNMEARLSSIRNMEDWSIFKESLRHESIVKELVIQNSEYEGLVNMLEVLDTQIQSVWRDHTLSSDQKFAEIKKIGLQKSTMRASINSINVDKAISVITTVVLAAQRTVEDKLNSIDSAVYKASTDSQEIMDTAHIDKAIQQRTEVQMQLLETGRQLLDIYRSVSDFVSAELTELDKNLPSSNQFINDRVKPIGTQIFTPANTGELVSRISKALQENTLVWSQLEDKVDQCINTMFELCATDEKIIQYQSHVINMLKANRVEDVVVADTLLKRILRVYTGSDNSGRSSTTITWSGILSRRGNTLVIDLTGRAKFKEYGLTPILLGDFMVNRIERPLLCVETRGKWDKAELSDVISQVRQRLNYYQYVNVIVAPEDIDTLNMLCEEAYVVHYITDCSSTSIAQMRNVVKNNNVNNVARKLIMINTPISPLTIADNIGIDTTATKLITLPAMNEMRACSLKHDRPFEYDSVVRVYEEAFR